MARGRSSRTITATTLSRPQRGMIEGLRARRAARQLAWDAVREERDVRDADHPGYLYAYGAPANDKEREALEVLLGLEKGSLPDALTLNEVRSARMSLSVGSDLDRELVGLNAAIQEIEEHNGDRAPWNADALIASAVTDLSEAIAEDLDHSKSPGQLACAVSAAAGYRFGQPRKAPFAHLDPWLLSGAGISQGYTRSPRIKDGLTRLHEALLADEQIAADHLMTTLGFRRDSSDESWMCVREILAAPGARDMFMSLDKPFDHEVVSTQALTLFASSQFALGSARRGYGHVCADEDLDWFEAPHPALGGETPAALIRTSPRRNWTRVLDAARSEPRA